MTVITMASTAIPARRVQRGPAAFARPVQRPMSGPRAASIAARRPPRRPAAPSERSSAPLPVARGPATTTGAGIGGASNRATRLHHSDPAARAAAGAVARLSIVGGSFVGRFVAWPNRYIEQAPKSGHGHALVRWPPPWRHLAAEALVRSGSAQEAKRPLARNPRSTPGNERSWCSGRGRREVALTGE